ncbi:hypothetical protein F4778DRAFT_725077 [Xylariomycetidae sp. FL2044]|nr:hypothetical protein F4778DRAFT_725077 [Xylariomycetidae sp. FL2044]
MDPISALGVAAAVVQFFDFTTKKCLKVQELYTIGKRAMVSDLALKTTAADFVKFSELIKSKKYHGGSIPQGDNLGQSSEAINLLVDECLGVAERLASIFGKLEDIRETHDLSENQWSRTLALFKAAWKMSDIKGLIEELSTFQSQLSLRMLQHLTLATEASHESQSERLKDIKSTVVEVSAVFEDKVGSVMRQGESLRRRLEDSEMRGIMSSDKILKAVLKLQNGDVRLLSSGDNDPSTSDRDHQGVMTLRAASQTLGAATTQFGKFDPVESEKLVLESLYFRRHSERYDSVKHHHERTCEWIFQDPEDAELPWTPFVPWLESDSKCFWINGKAGSGKSTLLKFVFEDPRTGQALQRWVSKGDGELIRASFFFSNLGSDLQKSQTGLLRGLLYEILQNHPALISKVMPDLWMTIRTRKLLDPPSLTELLKWFHVLIEQTASRFRIFFLIDGIDEYEGDHLDIVNLIRSASSREHVKFLISSRPLPSCVASFSSLPGLRLQDLTRNDIQLYAEEWLKDPLHQEYQDRWKEIINPIVEKSCGVFLWVVLVVRSVLAGLHNHDHLNELLDRLNELPTELKDLYAHMLRRLPVSYRENASQLFQICLLARDIQSDQHWFAPRQLHFAETDNHDVVKTPMGPLPSAMESRIGNTVEGRIRSRCYGLLEIVPTKSQMGRLSGTSLNAVSVEFIHRSAVEFLRAPEVWSSILAFTADTPFHPAVRLLQSSVLICKTITDNFNLEWSLVWYFMQRALIYASIAEQANKPVSTEYLRELDAVMGRHWKEAGRCILGSNSSWTTGHWSRAFELYHRPNSRDLVTLYSARRPLSFHSLAVYFCLNKFIQDESLKPKQTTALLYDALRYALTERPSPIPIFSPPMAPRYASVCNLLLSQGADPNAQIDDRTQSAWQFMLLHAAREAPKKQSFHQEFEAQGAAYSYSKLLVSFVKHGADVNLVVDWPSACAPPGINVRFNLRLSVLSALDYLFSDVMPEQEIFDPYQAWTTTTTTTTAGPPSGLARSEEVQTFHRYLTEMLVRKGARKRIWKDGKLVEGLEEPNESKEGSGGLAPPSFGSHRKTRSAEDLVSDDRRSGIFKSSTLFSSWVKKLK